MNNEIQRIIEIVFEKCFSQSDEFARPWSPEISQLSNQELEAIIAEQCPYLQNAKELMPNFTPEKLFANIYHTALVYYIHRLPQPTRTEQ